MNPAPITEHEQVAGCWARWARRHPAARALLAGAAAGCLLGVPALAQASPRPLPETSGSALCSGVSPSQVQGVVGFSVPAAVATTTSDYFDKTLGIHENSVVCTYGGTATSLTAMQHDVTLIYETLSKVPPRTVALAEIRADFTKEAKEMPPGSTFTYKFSQAFGVTSLWAKVSAKEGTFSFTFEYAVGWQGTKVAGGWVDSGLAQSKVQGLEKLALANMGI